MMRHGHTNVGLAKEPAALGGGRRRRRVLDLRGGGSARLAHGVCAVHGGGVGWDCLWCVVWGVQQCWYSGM
jgi:hypothetical protein